MQRGNHTNRIDHGSRQNIVFVKETGLIRKQKNSLSSSSSPLTSPFSSLLFLFFPSILKTQFTLQPSGGAKQVGTLAQGSHGSPEEQSSGQCKGTHLGSHQEVWCGVMAYAQRDSQAW